MVDIRPARKSDAPLLARLIDIAGEGIPSFLWQSAAEPGESALDVGRRRAERDEGGFSWTNARVADLGGEVVAMLLGYRQPDRLPDIDFSEIPAFLHPLLELESLVPGSWYINALAVLPEHRGAGLGSRLLAEAGGLAARARATTISLIVDDANEGAKRLYDRHGYVQIARRPALPIPGGESHADWVLLVRDTTVAGRSAR